MEREKEELVSCVHACLSLLDFGYLNKEEKWRSWMRFGHHVVPAPTPKNFSGLTLAM